MKEFLNQSLLRLNTSYYNLKPKSLAIYIHVPWCLQKCHYCDFYSIGIKEEKKSRSGHTITPELSELYIEKVLHEFKARLHDTSSFHKLEKVHSIYFGGGTPSLLETRNLEKLLKKLLERIEGYFDLEADCEISLEGNPEDMSPEYLEELYNLGIRRVNVGLQSFKSHILESMNRFYSPEAYSSILQNLSESPFENYGLDLIYGFPKQSKEDFYTDLKRVLSISPPHLSVYSLTVEKNTAYGKAVQKQKSPAPDEELQVEIWEKLNTILRKAKLQHYEVSNFAREDKWCRHNLSYWLYTPYMGLGPGAHGFDGKLRYANPRNLDQWLQGRGQSSYSVHEPSLEIPLMFLRLSSPWPLSLWEKLLSEKSSLSIASQEAGAERLYKWAEQGFANIFSVSHRERENKEEQKFFQWKLRGLSFLNDRILEMHESLSLAS